MRADWIRLVIAVVHLGPDIGTVVFLLAWRKYLLQCFIGVSHALV